MESINLCDKIDAAWKHFGNVWNKSRKLIVNLIEIAMDWMDKDSIFNILQ